MGQVLTFPAQKKANTSVNLGADKSASKKTDNVVLFEGVFIEYHDRPVVQIHACPLKWVSDTHPTPRTGRH